MASLTSSTKVKNPCSFTGEVMDEESWLEKSKLANDEFRILVFWMFKIYVAVYLGEHEQARYALKNLMKYNLGSAGANIFQIYYLEGLVDIVSARDRKSNGGSGKAKKYKSSLKKLRLYSKKCPSNANNRILLIEAEAEVLASKKGKSDIAVSKFHQSIEAAKENNILHEEAYANERCAIAMLEWGDVTHALEYFERALNLYEEWGSPVKVKRLSNYIEEK